jgi:hypothetical protein
MRFGYNDFVIVDGARLITPGTSGGRTTSAPGDANAGLQFLARVRLIPRLTKARARMARRMRRKRLIGLGFE